MCNNDLINVAIICTKDRELELNNLLLSIEKQSISFSKVIVVDSSKNNKNFLSKQYSFTIEHYKTRPGLTYQRNFGLNKAPVNTDFLHFLDDDVELEQNYLFNFKDFILRNPHHKVFTGRQINACTFSLSNLFLRLTRLNGKILFNGMNFSPDYCIQNRYKELEWMPGCNMIISHKFMASNKILFDEKYRTGYCMGEDVDISIKLQKLVPIIYLPNSIYWHKRSDQNRLNEVDKHLDYLLHRYILTRVYPEKFSKRLFILSVYLEQITFLFLKVVRGKKKFSDWYMATKKFKSSYKNEPFLFFNS